MEITTILGIALVFIFTVVSIFWGGGEISSYIDMPSVFIVVGGVLAATVATYPIGVLKDLIKVISNAFKTKNMNLNEDIEMIIKLANIVRREGVLALEDTANTTEDPFLKKGLNLVVDGANPELVKSILETDLSFLQERHSMNQSVLLQMSAYSPAFGMIGTLVGLINLLKNMSDTASLGPAMSVALVTTFYGTLLANGVFTPLAKKLKKMSDDEVLRGQMILEGILSINDGENPRIIKDKLTAFLSRSQLEAGGKKGAGQGEAAFSERAEREE